MGKVYNDKKRGNNNKKNRGQIPYDAGDILSIITKVVNEKGKIKGKNKETLLFACGHHLIKNGKKKPYISTRHNKNSGKAYLHCRLCKADFTGALLTDEQVHNALIKPQDMIQQMKFIMHASDADKESIRFVTEAAIILYRLPKVYKNMRKVIEKQNQLKKKSKKREFDDLHSFGSWE